MGIFNKKSRAKKLTSLDELEPMLETGKPILVDLMQQNCGPCRIMDGIVNELAVEYGESVHIVKVDVTKVPGRSPDFRRSIHADVRCARHGPTRRSRRRRNGRASRPKRPRDRISPRWRQAGLVKKDQLSRVLESNGAYEGHRLALSCTRRSRGRSCDQATRPRPSASGAAAERNEPHGTPRRALPQRRASCRCRSESLSANGPIG